MVVPLIQIKRTYLGGDLLKLVLSQVCRCIGVLLFMGLVLTSLEIKDTKKYIK